MGDATDQTGLIWRAGDLPFSARFGDPYFSAADGLAEARHVFLGGCGLPGGWAGLPAFRVAELGFGTGLGFLAARALWRQTRAPGAVLHVTSFELWPLPGADMLRALARWTELAPLAAELAAAWRPAGGRFDFGDTCLDLVVGDARETVPGWTGVADAWFLDGFAPRRNPEMWEPALIRAVFDRTAPGGRLATYSSAGAVRRALAASGFVVATCPGFGPKREMTVALRGA